MFILIVVYIVINSKNTLKNIYKQFRSEDMN